MLNARNVEILLFEDDPLHLRLVRATGVLSAMTGLEVAVADSPWLISVLTSMDVEVFDGNAADDPMMALHDIGTGHACGIATALQRAPRLLVSWSVSCDAERGLTGAELT